MHELLQRGTDEFTRAKPAGLKVTQRQISVLSAISQCNDKHRAPSQMEIVDIAGIDRSTLADMISRMIKRGLIERARSSMDGRAYALRITQDGKDLLAASSPYAAHAEAGALQKLSKDKQAQLEQLLNEALGNSTPRVVAAA